MATLHTLSHQWPPISSLFYSNCNLNNTNGRNFNSHFFSTLHHLDVVSSLYPNAPSKPNPSSKTSYSSASGNFFFFDSLFIYFRIFNPHYFSTHSHKYFIAFKSMKFVRPLATPGMDWKLTNHASKKSFVPWYYFWHVFKCVSFVNKCSILSLNWVGRE